MLLAGCHCLCPPPAAAATAPLRILLLHPTDLLMPGTVAEDQLTRKALSETLKQPLEFYSEGFDELRIVGPSREAQTIDLLLMRFQTHHPNLVIFHGPMHDIVSRNRHKLWPGVPIMFVGVAEHRLSDPSFPQGIPGTTIRFDLPGTVELAMRLQPEARRLIAVTGNSTYDRARQERAAPELDKFRGRLAVELIGDRTLGELTQLVASLKADTIVVFISMFRDAANHIYTSRDVAQELAAHSGAPVYVLNEGQIGLGPIGGSVAHWHGQSAAIGDIAQRLLAGQHPDTVARGLPVPPVCRVDWGRLRHWGIPLQRVPENCEVLYRTPPMWVQYRTQAILIGVIILAQAALITTLLMLRHVRRKAELEAERQRTQLAHATRLATVGELSASIAHEISQPLFAILINAQSGEKLLDAEKPRLAEIRQILGQIRRDDERASNVIRKLRELLCKRPIEMRPLHANEIVTGVLSFIGGTLFEREVKVLTSLFEELPAIRGDRVQIEQVLMNLFMNAVEAMSAVPPERRCLSVTTANTPDGCVEIMVGDNGPGIPPERIGQLFDPFFTTKREGMGLGLSIAHSIVTAHAGRLWAESRTDGAIFRLRIPHEQALQPATACSAEEEEVPAHSYPNGAAAEQSALRGHAHSSAARASCLR
jgi:signal transduction histidine kinase